MKYLEDARLTQLTSDLTGAFLNTRGSGGGTGGSASLFGMMGSGGGRGGGGAGSRGRGRRQQQQQHLQLGASGGGPSGSSNASRKNKKSAQQQSTTPSYYTYNPEGYSAYTSTGTGGYVCPGGSSPNSCRVIYGRVEAYTTKRAGSDKKTAFEVGERYGHEMARLNEAVEALKRRHLEMQRKRREEVAGDTDDFARIHRQYLVYR